MALLKKLLLLSFITAPLTVNASSYNLPEEKLDELIKEEALKILGIRAKGDYASSKERDAVNTLVKEIKKKVANNNAAFIDEAITIVVKKYNQKIVKDDAVKATLAHIKERAWNIAYAKVQSVNQANAIADAIATDAQTALAKGATLEDYFNQEVMVKKVINKINELFETNGRAKLFPTDNCCVCFDDMTPKNRRFLNCGHDICGSCLGNLPKKECPLCRAKITTTYKQS